VSRRRLEDSVVRAKFFIVDEATPNVVTTVLLIVV
jgi:hypothetical protein